MRADERDEPEPGTRVGSAQLLDGTGGGPAFHGAVRGLRAHLRHVVHLRAFAHQRLEMVVFGVLAVQPGGVGIARPLLGRVVQLFAVQMQVVPQLLVPRLAVKLADAEGAIAQLAHGRREVAAAAAGDGVGLAGGGRLMPVREDPGGGRLTAGADGVARRYAHRAGRIGVREAESAAYEPIQVRRMDVPVAERRDGVEALLVGHDEQHVRFLLHDPKLPPGVAAFNDR